MLLTTLAGDLAPGIAKSEERLNTMGQDDTDHMDWLIEIVFRNLSVGATIEQIHEAMLKRGYSEEDLFLALKAGQNLYDAIETQEQELVSRPAPFGRR